MAIFLCTSCVVDKNQLTQAVLIYEVMENGVESNYEDSKSNSSPSLECFNERSHGDNHGFEASNLWCGLCPQIAL